MARTTFFPLRANDIHRETADTVSLALDVPEDLAEEFRFSPGQFLTFRVNGHDGVPVRRSYSICSIPSDGELRVLVKRLPGGVFGELAHSALAVGDVLETLPPQGRFTTAPDAAATKAYLAIAAGSGISPVISVIRSVLAGEPGSRVTLLYGNRGVSSVIFRDALSDLKDLYLQRFQLIYVFSREPQDAVLLNGRIDAEKLRLLAKGMIDVPGYDEFFVCGPEPMTLASRETLIELGADPTTVHLELYGSHVAKPARPAAATGSDEVAVSVVLGGRRQTVSGQRDETILDAVNAAGLDAPFSCTGGVCATCRARVVDGGVEMAVNYSLEPWELEAGFVLTCQALPTSDAVTIDYDAV